MVCSEAAERIKVIEEVRTMLDYDENTTTAVYDSEGKCIGHLQPIASAKVLAASAGIQGHSKGKLALALVSAYRGETGDEERHAELLERLRGCGLDCGEVTGSYKGTEEQAVLVELTSKLDWQRVLQAAKRYGQESVLFIGEDRRAWLHYLDEDHTPVKWSVDGTELLGKLEAISPQKAATLDSWTRTSNGQHYGVISQ